MKGRSGEGLAEGRERLLRYAAGPAVALARVNELPDGRVAYRVEWSRGDGRGESHRLMTPMEFMARLAALVPPPRHPLVRYHGVFAPNSPWRVTAVLLPPMEEPLGSCATGVTSVKHAVAGSMTVGGDEADGVRAGAAVRIGGTKGGRIEWVRLLWRAWK